MSPTSIGRRLIGLALALFAASVGLFAVWGSITRPAETADSERLTVVWSSREAGNTSSAAWADWDGDGDLDLALGSESLPNRVYRNDNGNLALSWEAATVERTKSLAWGDWDNDGDLDLAVGNYGAPDHIYANLGGALSLTPTWSAPYADTTTALAWGDWDQDNDLDLAVGLQGGVRIYANSGGSLMATQLTTHTGWTTAVAWGDWDADNDLDLAVGRWGVAFVGQNLIYDNLGGMLGDAIPVTEPGGTSSLAWGDWDGNGLLDLAVGYLDRPAAIYTNTGGALQPAWEAAAAETTRSVAWGDWDADGDLDLAVGNGYGLPSKRSRVYETVAPGTTMLDWTLPVTRTTVEVAWGDWDGDGDLDLVTANNRQSTHIIAHNWQDPTTPWHPAPMTALGAAWGDWDSDGDLDLAVSSSDGAVVYANAAAGLEDVPAWQAALLPGPTWRAAWGDVDGDADLDLAVSNLNGPLQLYANQGGAQQLQGTTASPLLTPTQVITTAATTGLAWGDWDGDGDLDLAVGFVAQPVTVYRNTDGLLVVGWRAPTAPTAAVMGVAWGDWDADGDLDLAVGNLDGRPQVYANHSGDLRLAWEASEIARTTSIDWGDWDDDGDLDLAVGNSYQSNWVYANDAGVMRLAWQSAEADQTVSVDWGDWDGDGDLDLAAGNNTAANHIYVNQGGTLALGWTATGNDYTTALDWGDVDGDGDLDLATVSYDLTLLQPRPGRIWLNRRLDTRLGPWAQIAYPAGGGVPELGSSRLLQGPDLTLTYRLFSPTPTTIRFIRAFYSLDNGRHWQPAVAAAGTITQSLLAAPDGPTYTYGWDVHASRAFGRSDQAIFRLEVYAGFAAGQLYDYPFRAAHSLPFRLQGNQVRVVNEAGDPLARATVYRHPLGQATYSLYRDAAGRPLRTDAQGYLPGYGAVQAGDALVALAPITTTQTYTLYHSNGSPTPAGLEGFTVTAGGVQTLTVTAAQPVLGFDLTASLEWDARLETAFLTQLENDLQRAGQILYDLTDGQALIERLTIYQARQKWQEADLIIQASNSQRPAAMAGGIVTTPTHDIGIGPGLTQTTIITDAYVPGQVRMGPTWSRFGDPGGILGEDWPRALAHELGHYLFFMPDNYVGLSAANQIIGVDCYGSAMSDPYAEAYSEFLTPAEWQGDCLNTLAERYLGRADWETIATFYPMLDGVTINAGPIPFPLEDMPIAWVEPVTPTMALLDPFFSLVDAAGLPAPVPTGEAQAILFRAYADGDPTNDYVQALGAPVGDLVQARGAEPGDRLCVYDYSQLRFVPGPSGARLGCLTLGVLPTRSVALLEAPGWSPHVLVTPINSHTLQISVTQVVSDSALWVQGFSSLERASSAETPMLATGSGFSQTITLPRATNHGFVRVWAASGTREALSEFLTVADWSTKGGSWGTKGGSWGTKGGSWGAPLLSSDGQMALFLLDNPFGSVAGYTVQTLPFAPGLPIWLTAVGPAYRLTSDGPLPASALLFHYLGRDVPGGYESLLRLYFSSDEGQTWQVLPTELDSADNHASAQTAGAGLYVLAVTVEITPQLQGEAWNLIGYPIPATQPLPEALASIEGFYTSVYNFDPVLGWRLYDATVALPFAPLVNTLAALEFGRGYWIYATQTVTLYLGIEGEMVQAGLRKTTLSVVPVPIPDQVAWPPATYYGWVTPAEGFTPAVGDPVIAWVDGVMCGSGVVTLLEGQLAYTLPVRAEDPFGGNNGCGLPDRLVTFEVAGALMAQTVLWDNTQAQLLDLTPAGEGEWGNE